MISEVVLIRSVNQHDLLGGFNQMIANRRGIVFTNQLDTPPRRQQLPENAA
jgi:hypothetical protein